MGRGWGQKGVDFEDDRECREGRGGLQFGGMHTGRILVKKSVGLMRPGRKTRRKNC
jgi:hypothetical protein